MGLGEADTRAKLIDPAIHARGCYQNGLSIRDRRLKAKYGGRFFRKCFELPFPTASTLKLSGAHGQPSRGASTGHDRSGQPLQRVG